jgi:hypothetical protein
MSVLKPSTNSGTRETAAAAVIGRLAASTDGRARIAREDGGSVPARHVAGLDPAQLTAPVNVGREVLLLYEAGDPGRPVILAWMAEPGVALTVTPAETARVVRVDGKHVVIEAAEEILLQCGRGSILIREDGAIVIKGTNLLSRSSGINKIKGGAVRIN